MPYEKISEGVSINRLLGEFSDLLEELDAARARVRVRDDDEASMGGDYKRDPEADARLEQAQREAVVKLVRFVQARGDEIMADFVSGEGAWVW